MKRLLAALTAATLTAALGVATTGPAAASDNGLALTPQLGWNSWNAFRCDIDQTKIRAAADALVSTGLAAAGYQYVNVDDCWQATTRDASGRLRSDPTRFPDGIKALADYVHGKGLKFGIYATPGTRTCANIWDGYPGTLGSKGREALDAQTFADWGVDYLKYDWCRADEDGLDPEAAFRLMQESLEATGRPILYSIHREPQLPIDPWRTEVANSWRTTPDIRDNWSSMIGIAHANQPLAAYAGPGGWNDPDMLEVGNGGMTATEYRTHMSLWAVMAAPLLIGANLATADSTTIGILGNADVLAVDQDPLGKQGTVVSSTNGLVVMSKPLADGSRAVTLTNEGASTATITTSASAIGLGGASSYTVKDLWSKAVTTTSGSISASVVSHGTVMFRVTPGQLVPPPSGTSHLSDLQWTSASNGWGPVEKDQSVGEQQAGDGRALTVNGVAYAKGLGVHAASEVRYHLGGGCSSVVVDVGVDDEVSAGSVVFQLWRDGVKVADSGVKTASQGATRLTGDLTGGSELRLVVSDAGDGIASDHADWGNPRLACGGSVEAESGVRGGAAVVAGCAACSGGSKVGYIGNGAGNDVTLTVDSASAGSRQVTVFYLLDGNRSFSVSVNGGAAQQMPLSGTSWSTPAAASLTVSLVAGANTIRFFNASAYAPDLDRVTVG